MVAAAAAGMVAEAEPPLVGGSSTRAITLGALLPDNQLVVVKRELRERSPTADAGSAATAVMVAPSPLPQPEESELEALLALAGLAEVEEQVC